MNGEIFVSKEENRAAMPENKLSHKDGGYALFIDKLFTQ